MEARKQGHGTLCLCSRQGKEACLQGLMGSQHTKIQSLFVRVYYRVFVRPPALPVQPDSPHLFLASKERVIAAVMADGFDRQITIFRCVSLHD